VGRLNFRLLLLTSAAATFVCPVASAQKKGEGSIRLEYQYVRTGAFVSSIGESDIGNTDGHTILISLNYALTDRWTLSASLPWINKRHQGALPHDPVVDITQWTPPDLTLVDDGQYHSGLQDLYVGVGYLAKSGPLTIEPHISFGTPVQDYQVYAHAALGRDIWHLPVGVFLDYQPALSDFFFSGDFSYVFTEKTLGVDISHFLIYGAVGYYVTPRIAPKIFVNIKQGNKGLDFPDDYDLTALNDEIWYNHDRMIQHNFINAGVSVDWVVNDRYLLSFSWFKMIDPDQVNIVDRAWTVGVTRRFSSRRW
jgi:hypothetical protein